MKIKHQLVDTLVNLRGNPRACVYTEPLWGIPNNLYAPYASLYMYSLGVKDTQIGLIATIGMIFQILFSLLSGAITDKLGRRWTTFIFDFLCWSIPCIIWAVAQNFTYFLVAAIINSTWKITDNSWQCLLVEDCEPELLVDIYAWTNIAGLVAAFFAPLSGLFVNKFSLVPTVRVLYIIAFIMMTSKFIILFRYSTETKQGRKRLEETKNESIVSLLGGYGNVLKKVLHSRETLLTLGVMLIMSICVMVNNSFWSIIVTEKIHIPVGLVANFPFFRSFIMLIFFFLVIPRIHISKIKKPMLTGFCLFIISQIILITTPENGYAYLIISTILEACSLALINPFVSSLIAITVDPQERARIMSIIAVVVITFTAPFGLIAGVLSSINRVFPFIMNITLFLIGAFLTYLSTPYNSEKA